MRRNGPNHPAEEMLSRDAEPLRNWLMAYFRRRVGNEPENEDLVQEVFARIVARNSQEPIQHLGGYIAQTAASVLADRGRRRGARLFDAHVSFDPEHDAPLELDPERVMIGRQELNFAVAALLSLPERTRTIFILHRLEHEKYKDIAARLGISVSAVEKQMVRAIQHLANHLGDRRAS